MDTMTHKLGTGVMVLNTGLPVHNPTPTTKRGKARHASRGDDAKKLAEKAWGTGRAKIKGI